MQKNNLITVVGALGLEVEIKTHKALTMTGESTSGKFKKIEHGGPNAKLTRILDFMLYQVSLFGYLGNDEIGSKILSELSKENLDANIQKIPNDRTAFFFKLRDSFSFSTLTTTNSFFSLVEQRFEAITKSEVLVLDRTLPFDLKLKIIKKKVANQYIIIGSNYEEILKLQELKSNKLILIFSDYDLSSVDFEAKKEYSIPESILKEDLFKGVNIILHGQDETFVKIKDKIVYQNTMKVRMHKEKVNAHFLAGLCAGLVSKKDLKLASSWGLACDELAFKQFDYSRETMVKKAQKFTFEDSF